MMMLKRQFWGVVLILLGGLALLQAMGIYNFGLAFWPVLWVLIGLSALWNGLRHGSWFGMVFGIWLGGYGLLDILHNAGVTELTGSVLTRNIWPLLLVAVGLGLLFGRRSWIWKFGMKNGTGRTRSGMIGDWRYGRDFWTLDGDLNLEHGIGDVKVDLTTAEITPGVHKITCNAWIGEYFVRVPNNVTVYVDASLNVGELDVLGERRAGTSPSISKSVLVDDSDVELHIDARMGIGSLRIVQGPPVVRVIP